MSDQKRMQAGLCLDQKVINEAKHCLRGSSRAPFVFLFRHNNSSPIHQPPNLSPLAEFEKPTID